MRNVEGELLDVVLTKLAVVRKLLLGQQNTDGEYPDGATEHLQKVRYIVVREELKTERLVEDDVARRSLHR